MKIEPPEPTAIVIFGASGDLARRKLLPALFHLYLEDLLPASFAVVGYARTEMSDEEFRERARNAVNEFGRCDSEPAAWKEFAEKVSFVGGEFEGPGAFSGLESHLEGIDREHGTEGRRLFYCATPPDAFAGIVAQIGERGMQANARIVVEKPFGSDLQSARELNEIAHAVFDESQVFRIDHYLGKETVQNILVLRFANTFLEPLWNRQYVDHVQLTVAEEIGIEGRGRFYERTGVLRDMVQTHLFQVLTFLGMEAPASFDPERLRDEKVKLLHAVRPLRAEDIVCGQYRGYRDEKDVAPDSQVPTYFACRLEIDNWRWAGVPFFLRSGKSLARKQSEALVVFREIPHMIFERAGIEGTEANHLVLRLQPNEGVSLWFTVQRPGIGIELESASLEFDYRHAFETPLVGAYELLLREAMRGDHTLFTRQDGVERAWEILQPLLEAPPALCDYDPGSWGPKEAGDLVAPRRWLMSDLNTGSR